MDGNSEKITLRETFRLHRRAIGEARRVCPGVFAATALHAVASALSPYAAVWFSARILDELAGQRRPEALWPLVLGALGSAALLTLAAGLLKRWMAALQSRYSVGINRLYMNKQLSMDFADVDRAEIRDLRSQIRQNSQWGGWGFQTLPYFFERLVQGVAGLLGAAALTVSLFTLPVPEGAGALTLFNSPAVALLLAAILVLAAALSPMCRNRVIQYQMKSAEDAKFGNRLFCSFGFIGEEKERAMDIRMYRQQELARHYLKADVILASASRYARDPAGAWAALGGSVSAVLTGLIYAFVCLKAWAGAFGAGAVTQYVGAATAMMQNLTLLLTTVGRMKGNAAFLRTAYRFLDIPNAMYQGSLTTEKRSDRQYEVEFQDVSFRYPGSEAWALRHVSLKFQVGRRLAVVGENGSGKTTFIKLLCRLYDPQEGRILLNGIDIRKYSYRDYLGIFAVVFQDFQLIAQPLGANVAGAQQYDRARAKKALIDAGFGERLAAMPGGLDTMLYREFAKDGVEVSGGEAQKIAIARALYKDGPFLILDEPTAALDPVAEAEIYSKFDEIAGDKTAIYISHRLSSCKFCDEIVVFDRGAVVQKGSHAELTADTAGKYYALWNAQAQYYTEQQEA